MSRSHNYFSKHVDGPRGDGEDIRPRDSYQEFHHSTNHRPESRGFVPFPTPPERYGEYQAPSRGAIPPSFGERLSPATGFLQSLPHSQRAENIDLDRSMGMLPPITRPAPYGALRRLPSFDRGESQLPRTPSEFQSAYSPSYPNADYGLMHPPDASGHSSRPCYPNMDPRSQSSSSSYPWDTSHQFLPDRLEYDEASSTKRSTITVAGPSGDERRSKRYRGGRDEFDGSVQYLQKPRTVPEPRERDLPPLPIHLDDKEQDVILSQVNKQLSQCAFDFIALYRFPIPIEPSKPAVQVAADKPWTEWAYLLKRLATKRKIPSHAIFQGQIKELTTVLDNSLEMRHATKPQPRPLKDDRTVLQFISAGIQVGRILKDAATMEYLDKLYQQTEKVIQTRKEPSLPYQ